jgi:hypothetical protein
MSEQGEVYLGIGERAPVSMHCRIHGEVDGGRFNITIMVEGEPSEVFCFFCYRDWMRANISPLASLASREG